MFNESFYILENTYTQTAIHHRIQLCIRLHSFYQLKIRLKIFVFHMPDVVVLKPIRLINTEIFPYFHSNLGQKYEGELQTTP